MTRKQILSAIEENPGKGLYVRYTVAAPLGPILGFFDPISKTRALRAARYISKIEYGKYIDFRPDLRRYYDAGRLNGGDSPIVLFTVAESVNV